MASATASAAAGTTAARAQRGLAVTAGWSSSTSGSPVADGTLFSLGAPVAGGTSFPSGSPVAGETFFSSGSSGTLPTHAVVFLLSLPAGQKFLIWTLLLVLRVLDSSRPLVFGGDFCARISPFSSPLLVNCVCLLG